MQHAHTHNRRQRLSFPSRAHANEPLSHYNKEERERETLIHTYNNITLMRGSRSARFVARRIFLNLAIPWNFCPRGARVSYVRTYTQGKKGAARINELTAGKNARARAYIHSDRHTVVAGGGRRGWQREREATREQSVGACPRAYRSANQIGGGAPPPTLPPAHCHKMAALNQPDSAYRLLSRSRCSMRALRSERALSLGDTYPHYWRPVKNSAYRFIFNALVSPTSLALSTVLYLLYTEKRFLFVVVVFSSGARGGGIQLLTIRECGAE